MKLPGLVVLASLSLPLSASRAADASTPVDYTQRNGGFTPAATITPDKKSPEIDSTLQDKRFEKTKIEKQPAAVGERRAAIDVQETREKTVREKNSRRPDVVEQPTSTFNHREASISTAGDTKKPPMVTKYQDGLAAASASNMARFPALDKATGAKINRFVFRKNTPEPGPVSGGSPAESTVRAGGQPVLK